jgi:hypothetical protein
MFAKNIMYAVCPPGWKSVQSPRQNTLVNTCFWLPGFYSLRKSRHVANARSGKAVKPYTLWENPRHVANARSGKAVKPFTLWENLDMLPTPGAEKPSNRTLSEKTYTCCQRPERKSRQTVHSLRKPRHVANARSGKAINIPYVSSGIIILPKILPGDRNYQNFAANVRGRIAADTC